MNPLTHPTELHAVVPGDPVPPGYSIILIHRKGSKRPSGSLRMSSAARAWRDAARIVLEQANPSKHLLDGPLWLELVFFLPRPLRLVWKSRPMPAVWAPVLPDRTNLLKLAEDALKGVWITDDARIVDGPVRKFYVPGPGFGDHRPRVEFTVRELLPEAQPRPVQLPIPPEVAADFFQERE